MKDFVSRKERISVMKKTRVFTHLCCLLSTYFLISAVGFQFTSGTENSHEWTTEIRA